MIFKHSEKWYHRRLEAYFEKNYSTYEDYTEWSINPDINQWLFYIPALGMEIKLTCNNSGKVTEKRSLLSINVNQAYHILEDECSGMDAVYEDHITTLVGATGLNLLRNAGRLEMCGVINGRTLYALCKN